MIAVRARDLVVRGDALGRDQVADALGRVPAEEGDESLRQGCYSVRVPERPRSARWGGGVGGGVGVLHVEPRREWFSTSRGGTFRDVAVVAAERLLLLGTVRRQPPTFAGKELAYRDAGRIQQGVRGGPGCLGRARAGDHVGGHFVAARPSPSGPAHYSGIFLERRRWGETIFWRVLCFSLGRFGPCGSRRGRRCARPARCACAFAAAGEAHIALFFCVSFRRWRRAVGAWRVCLCLSSVMKPRIFRHTRLRLGDKCRCEGSWAVSQDHFGPHAASSGRWQRNCGRRVSLAQHAH